MLIMLIKLGAIALGSGLAAYGTSRMVVENLIPPLMGRDPREVMGPIALLGSVAIGVLPVVGPIFAPVLLMFGLGNVVAAVTNRAQLVPNGAPASGGGGAGAYAGPTSAPLPAQ